MVATRRRKGKERLDGGEGSRTEESDSPSATSFAAAKEAHEKAVREEQSASAQAVREDSFVRHVLPCSGRYGWIIHDCVVGKEEDQEAKGAQTH